MRTGCYALRRSAGYLKAPYLLVQSSVRYLTDRLSDSNSTASADRFSTYGVSVYLRASQGITGTLMHQLCARLFIRVQHNIPDKGNRLESKAADVGNDHDTGLSGVLRSTSAGQSQPYVYAEGNADWDDEQRRWRN